MPTMSARHIIAVLSSAMFCSLVSAADIRGTIIVKHRLIKRKVTPLASSYQRGVAVENTTEKVRRTSLGRSASWLT